ncbi:MAG: hypothetical protein R6U98_22940 [Pirellulaceae bacterium]
MSLVVCIFQTANDWLGSPDQFSKFLLCQTSIIAKVMDHARNLNVHPLGLDRSSPSGIILHMPIAKDLDGIARL